MFDIEKYLDAIIPLDFVWTEVKPGVCKWQDQMWDGDVKILFQPDTKSTHQGAVTERQKSWWVHTTRVIHYSRKDEKQFLIGVSLYSPND